MSIVPPRNSILQQSEGFAASMPIITYNSFEKIDFQRPEKYIKEIAHFLDSVTIAYELTKKMKKGQAFTSKQARELISTLLKLMAPNLVEEYLP